MDHKLINNWNARVKPDDYIFHIGDFCYSDTKKFNQYFHNLNGHIIFIQGNHDHNNGVNTPILDITIHHDGQNFLLIHKPQDIGYFGGLVLCGHVHANWKFDRRYEELKKNNFTDFCNVGVDEWNYYPITINEILDEYTKWKVKQP